jgi:hypothetical protein
MAILVVDDQYFQILSFLNIKQYMRVHCNTIHPYNLCVDFLLLETPICKFMLGSVLHNPYMHLYRKGRVLLFS